MNSEKQITIAWPVKTNIPLITLRAIESNFFTHLSQYANVVQIPYSTLISDQELSAKPDYMFMDMTQWHMELLIMREKGKLKMSFLLFFHVIYGPEMEIHCLIPFLKERDVIIVASEYAKKCFLNITNQFPIHVVPYTLDVAAIRSVIKPSSDFMPKIAFMGRLVPEKGIGELIRCIPILKEHFPDIHLEIIGPLSGVFISNEKNEFIKSLEQEIESLDLVNHVHWNGYHMDNRKYEILADCDVFINPSIYKQETFGIVNIEALASGLPVIATRWSAFDEIIIQGENGLLINVHENADGHYAFDPKELVDKIIILLKDRDKLNSMKRNAFAAAEKYDYRQVMPHLMSLLQKRDEDVIGDWVNTKDKKVSDFKSLYQPDWYDLILNLKINNTSFETMSLLPPSYQFSGMDPELKHKIFQYLTKSFNKIS